MRILKMKIQKASQRLQNSLRSEINIPPSGSTPNISKQANETSLLYNPKPEFAILRLDSITDLDLKPPNSLLRLDNCQGLEKVASTACTSQNTSRNSSDSILMKESAKPKRKAKVKKTANPTKNISINYGKAIISFGISHIALPYLAEFFDDFDYSYGRFVNFLKECRKKMSGMYALKSSLLVEKNDNEETVKFKSVFQKLSEIFIKYFSINWITYGKVTEKLVYLKYRFKMLRRIKNPEIFTYIHKNLKSKSHF
jgi:hypothetical protein